jgi:diphthamide biosynthesis methyltransferase
MQFTAAPNPGLHTLILLTISTSSFIPLHDAACSVLDVKEKKYNNIATISWCD